jgi:hypothetical protein
LADVKRFDVFSALCVRGRQGEESDAGIYLTDFIIYITGIMARKRIAGFITAVLLLVVAVNLLGAQVRNVVSAEAGYGYILSARALDPDQPDSLLASLSYGYVIHEKPKSMTALSLE